MVCGCPLFRPCGPPVSLRLGHAAGLTAHRAVIQHRVAASLPQGEGLHTPLFAPRHGRLQCSVIGQSRVAASGSGRRGTG